MSESRLLNCLCRGRVEGLLHSRTKRPLDSVSKVQSAVGTRSTALFLGTRQHISFAGWHPVEHTTERPQKAID